MSMKHIQHLSMNFKLILLLILILSVGNPIRVMADTSSPEPQKKIELTPPAENTDELFKEAAILTKKNPDEAIRLYKRAFQSKPDAWNERKNLALLYEKLGKPEAAASEYESINNAIDTAQSNTDLIRILEKTGALPAAAAVALRGAQKFPDDSGLAFFAGDLLLKSGQADMALEFIKRTSQKKPEDKKILSLLSQAYEKQGNEAAALRAYLKSMDTGISNDEQKKTLERLGKHAVRVEDLWFFLPRGWEKDKNVLINAIEGQRIYVDAHSEVDLNAIAMKVVKEKMPAGMFDDEKVRGYEEMRKMASEFSKNSPDAANGIKVGRLPVYLTKALTDNMKGLMVLASSGEDPSDFMQSVCALVLPTGNKVYTVAWVSSKSYQEGEKTLLSLVDYIVLPL